MRLTVSFIVMLMCGLCVSFAAAQATCPLTFSDTCQQTARGERCTDETITPVTAPPPTDGPQIMKLQTT
ncbi:MAG: hypothetical protein AAF653_17890, partial [Chloroflexota bacterium]